MYDREEEDRRRREEEFTPYASKPKGKRHSVHANLGADNANHRCNLVPWPQLHRSFRTLAATRETKKTSGVTGYSPLQADALR